MKKKELIILVLLMISLLSPCIAFAYAETKPTYVGINEGQTIIWDTEFDIGPLEDFYEDGGYSPIEAELIAEGEFNDLNWSESTEAIKLYIVDIEKEMEEKIYDSMDTLRFELDRVKIIYNLYKTKDREDLDSWKKMEKYKTAKIYEPKEKFYEYMVDLDYGFYHPSFENSIDVPALFVPKRLHFEDIVDEIDEIIEDNNLDNSNDASIANERIQYYLRKKAVGFSTEYNYKWTSRTETFESIVKYTDDGILYYYEYMYDGDTIAKFELRTFGGKYLIENWWWISILAGALIVVVIVVPIVIVIMLKKKNK